MKVFSSEVLPPVRIPQIVAPYDEIKEVYDEEDSYMDAEGFEDSEMNEIEEEDDEYEHSLVDKFAGGLKKVVKCRF